MCLGSPALRRTPLYDRHVEAGASSSTSRAGRCRSNTRACARSTSRCARRRDLRRLAHGRDRDERARGAELLQRLLSNDVAKIPAGRRPVQRAVPRGRRRDRRPVHLSPRGRPLPDRDERRQPRADLAWFEQAAASFRGAGARPARRYAMLAVQGPQAREIVQAGADSPLPERMTVATRSDRRRGAARLRDGLHGRGRRRVALLARARAGALERARRRRRHARPASAPATR